jgi:hypothetical protein
VLLDQVSCYTGEDKFASVEVGVVWRASASEDGLPVRGRSVQTPVSSGAVRSVLTIPWSTPAPSSPPASTRGSLPRPSRSVRSLSAPPPRYPGAASRVLGVPRCRWKVRKNDNETGPAEVHWIRTCNNWRRSAEGQLRSWSRRACEAHLVRYGQGLEKDVHDETLAAVESSR